MAAVADVSKEQTDMSYKGELQTHAKLYRSNLLYNHIRVHYNYAHVQGQT